MNQVLNVRQTEKGEQVISSRELHNFLEVKRDFTTWIKAKIESYCFEENDDYQEIWNGTESGDVKEYNGSSNSMVKLGYKKDYILKLDMAKEISMIENNEKGRMARKYFIECEKKLRGELLTSGPSLNRMLENLQEAALLRQQIDTMEKEFKAKMSLVNIEMVSYYR